MLNRRVKFRPATPEFEGEIDRGQMGVLQWIDPTTSMLKDLPGFLKKNSDVQEVVIYASELEDVWMRFCSGYQELAAAGGVVQDDEGHVLWIQRNGKWDLPKGKLEAGERLEDAAIREVEEETGIQDLVITGDALATFHTYETEGVVHLKTTFWYPMRHHGTKTKGVPQAVEGITDVTWLKPPFPDETLSKTFGSIRIVLDTLL